MRKMNLSPELKEALKELETARQGLQDALFQAAVLEARNALRNFWLTHAALMRTLGVR